MSSSSPAPIVQNPIRGTTVNTNPSQLHIDVNINAVSNRPGNDSQTSPQRTSCFVQRVANRAAETISPSRIGKRSGSSRLSSALRQSKAAQGSDASSGDEEDGHRVPESSNCK